VQVFETRKLQALTGRSWDSFIESFSETLQKADDPSLSNDDRLARLDVVQDQLRMSRRGWFEADTAEAYEAAVRETIKTLVLRPTNRRPKEESSVVAEISAELRSAKVLATKDEQLESGKVVRSYHVEAGLEADFAQLNSALHVAAVLDLRASRPQLAQAALKAVVLDRASTVNTGRKVHKIGVYAVAPARRGEVRENIDLLSRYADDLVNWEDPTDRTGLTRIFFDAFNAHVDALKAPDNA
jgi:transposase-like protein